MPSHQGILKIIAGERQDVAAKAIRTGLSLIEPGYRFVVSKRNARFDSGKRPAIQLDRPVVSIGNITTGGTGKTPMVIDLCQMLIDRGHTPGVLLRGYGGDEAEELKEAVADRGEVEPNPDRVAGSKAMLQRRDDVDVFLLDDGFQHRQVARDVDLVLVDATNPWGYGHVLPRGLLREPLTGLRRASAIILTRVDQVSSQRREELEKEIERHHGKPPEAQVVTRWTKLLHSDGSTHPIEKLSGMHAAALCGIGNPDAFFEMLKEAGVDMAMRQVFADHVPYDRAMVKRLEDVAADAGADAMIMTEKDWVKWRFIDERTMPVYRPQVGVVWMNGQPVIERMIHDAMKRVGASDAD